MHEPITRDSSRTAAALAALVLIGCNGTLAAEAPEDERRAEETPPGSPGLGSPGPAVDDDSSKPPPAEPDPIGLEVQEMTSTTVAVQWDAIEGATKTTVHVGPEPADERGEPLPIAQQVAALDGSETEYLVRELAPSVDVFIYVEIVTPEGSHASHTHARTEGGPRAELDGPVREVHGFAPDILRVTVTGGDGSAWQDGPWTVTRHDGSPIGVERVHRHSLPVSAPEYEVGWGAAYDNSVIVVDHRLHLELSEAIGSSELLQIEGPNGVQLMLPFSDQYLETPVVQLNQVGYNPRATQRWAYVSGWMGDGGGLDLGSMPGEAQVLAEAPHPWAPREPVVDDLPLESRAERDGHAGTAVDEIDLSALPASERARYRVRLPGVGVSWTTSVSEEASLKAYYVIARGLFHNRWGGDLAPEHTEWSRPPDHPTVYTAEGSDFTEFYDEGTPRTGERPLQGGYHDAGDFDQRPMHQVVPQLLMRAFELNEDAFPDGQLTIPESDNGIPDLLDEALWGVEAWKQLQEPSGGVRMGVESHAHPWGFYLAHEDPLPYWTYAVEPNVTARAAGLFAQASRLVQPYDADYADELREHAIDAWSYATEHGAKPAYRLYAAGELYRLTGEDGYAEAFEAAWHAMGDAGAFSSFAVDHLYMGDYTGDLDAGKPARAMPDYIVGYLAGDDAADELRELAEERLTTMADSVVRNLDEAHAHRNPRPQGYPFGWGNDATSAKYMDPILALLSIGELSEAAQQRYYDALSLAADFVLGGNPMGLVYVTGLGTRRVQEPLHLDSLVFIKEGLGPVPGLPVYGPTESMHQPWAEDALRTFHPNVDDYANARKYGDVRLFVKTNEFTVWESQAPLAQLFAVLAPGRMPPEAWLPGRAAHRDPLP